MSKLTDYADKAIEYLFYALFFFVPLILWPRTSEVFEFNKMLFVYAMTILIGAAWTVKWLDTKKVTIRATPLDFPILIFLASQILSTIFSIDTHTSLWGYYSRFHGGLMSTFSYIFLYYAFVSNIKISNLKYQISNILLSSILVCIYGVLEHFGIDKHLWVQDVQNRVFSTLGQPNWLSAYLVALLPLPIFHAIKNKKTILNSTFYLLTSILFLVTIWFTKSQSGIGATAVILFLIALYLFFKSKKIYFRLAAYCLLIAVLFGSIYKWQYLVKLNPLGPPDLARLVQIDHDTRFGGSDSMVIRQVVWQGAREIGRRNPLFGTGVETFGYSYFPVRPALHNLLSEWEFLYNKAHNEYLNILANTGYFGLLAYLFLIFSTLNYLRPKISNIKSLPADATHQALQAGQISNALLFGYLSILVTNYFGFSVVPVALFFFLFPAISFIASDLPPKYHSLNLHLNPTLGLLFLLPSTIYLLRSPYRQFTADLAYNQGKQYISASYLKPGLDSLEKAVRLAPNEPIFKAQLAEAAAVGAVSVKQQLDSAGASISAEFINNGEKLLNGFIKQALENSAKAIELNPHHTNFYKSKGKTELYLGTIDPKYNSQALQTLLELEALSPTDAKVIYNIGLLYESLNQVDNAKRYYQKAIALKPGYEGPTAALENLTKP